MFYLELWCVWLVFIMIVFLSVVDILFWIYIASGAAVCGVFADGVILWFRGLNMCEGTRGWMVCFNTWIVDHVCCLGAMTVCNVLYLLVSESVFYVYAACWRNK